ncbi:hypothetical protein [Loktanella sp. Alg231-35]|nr:hypothetical protein [Loktanella sp. Alg231-35]
MLKTHTTHAKMALVHGDLPHYVQIIEQTAAMQPQPKEHGNGRF